METGKVNLKHSFSVPIIQLVPVYERCFSDSYGFVEFDSTDQIHLFMSADYMHRIFLKDENPPSSGSSFPCFLHVPCFFSICL